MEKEWMKWIMAYGEMAMKNHTAYPLLYALLDEFGERIIATLQEGGCTHPITIISQFAPPTTSIAEDLNQLTESIIMALEKRECGSCIFPFTLDPDEAINMFRRMIEQVKASGLQSCTLSRRTH